MQSGVYCDICNKDYTDDNQSRGGFVFNGTAYGPCCAQQGMELIIKYEETKFIVAICPPNMSFATFIRDYRYSQLVTNLPSLLR